MWMTNLNKKARQMISLYKKEKKKSKKESVDKFHKKLKEKLIKEIKKDYKNDMMKGLKYYKSACQSYIDSDFLDFNISTVSILISIYAIVIVLAEKTELLFTSIVLLFIIGFVGIYSHYKKTTVIKILYVLNDIPEDCFKKNKKNNK